MDVKSPMSGNVWKLLVKESDKVSVGDVVVILESMKMEIPIEAEGSGVVSEIIVSEGDFVQEEDLLVTIK